MHVQGFFVATLDLIKYLNFCYFGMALLPGNLMLKSALHLIIGIRTCTFELELSLQYLEIFGIYSWIEPGT